MKNLTVKKSVRFFFYRIFRSWLGSKTVFLQKKYQPISTLNSCISLMNQFGSCGRAFFIMADFELQKPVVIPLENLADHGISIQFSQPGQSNPMVSSFAKTAINPVLPDCFQYENAFDLVMNHLNRGDTYLLNLTLPVSVQLSASLDELFHCASARYKILKNDEFLVFSPEIFVKIENGIISTFPMKGTIDADIPGAAELLMNDKKELAEHYTIVDLLRNDLSIVSKNVRVRRFRYIDHLHTNNKHLLQTSSEITGTLHSDWKSRLGDIVFSLLPAGSVSGAPKKRTCEIISKAEGRPRGYYTGIAGVFDGNSFDSCVMIRFIEKTNNGFVYHAGGGITTQSECRSEYQELIDKVYVPVV
jgi:para-aminobenzoate synthetase component I